MKNIEIELKIIDGTNQIVIVCAETGRQIGGQIGTVVETKNEGFTIATVTFEIKPIKDLK